MEKIQKNVVLSKIPLKRLTTLRIGGEPLFYCRPRSYAELAAVLHVCRRGNIDFRVLGGGSNLLVDDNELDFGVIHICNPGFNWIERKDDDLLHAGSGVTLTGMLGFCKTNGMGGAEFLAGIPGTVGGAIAGNAGARGSEVGSIIRHVVAVDKKGKKHRIHRSDIDFSYRRADLVGMIITEAEFKLPPRSPELVKKLIKNNIRRKKGAQPTGQPNAGCIFKNPENKSAGKLLDICGFKGRVLGGAKVSQAHANFICNHHRAAAEDVLCMIEEMKKAVKHKFGIELELEVKLWKGGENAKVA